MSGGIAKNMFLHGLTGRGGPVLPKVWTYLAGWGKSCTVFKDDEVLLNDYHCHFMLTEGVRQKDTREIPEFPSKEEIQKLIQAKRQEADVDRKGIQQNFPRMEPRPIRGPLTTSPGKAEGEK